jgi:hypothetical protein
MQPDSISAAIVSSPADGNRCCGCAAINEGHGAISGAVGAPGAGWESPLEPVIGTCAVR